MKTLQPELLRHLKTLMFLRVIVFSIFLGALIFVQIKETKAYFGDIQASHYQLICIVYFLTFIYLIIFRYSKNLLWFAYVQLLVDTMLITALIYTTGGMGSTFSLLYFLAIIGGSIILYRKGGMIIASITSLLYTLLICLQYYKVIQPLGTQVLNLTEYPAFYFFNLVLVNIGAFYMLAYLVSYLSEQSRRERVEIQNKQKDIDKLEVLNESIINSITSGLIALDGHYKIVLFNPAAEKIFGMKSSEISGQKVEEVLPFLRSYLTNEQCPLKRMAEKASMFIDLEYHRPGGKKIPIRFSISPLWYLLGNQRGYIFVFQDMTEIKRIEGEMKKVESLAMVGRLAAGVAHEIRNPMASISGSIQLLEDGLDKDNVNSRLINIISREVTRLNHLVDDFLVFARPKKAKLQSFDLNQLILEYLDLFKNSQYWTGNIDMHTKFHHPIKLESDPEQIKQVLWNLVLNACEAMPDGGSLYIVTDLESDQKKIKIVVRDTGSGFDETTLSQLFMPFFTTKEKGMGLGLSIVKGIVEGLRGEITGSNHPDGGAMITILFPLSPG